MEHPSCISSCPKNFSHVTSQGFGSIPRYDPVLRLRWTWGHLGGYLGIAPAFRTQLPHTEEGSAGMDELPRLRASPGKMFPLLWGQTLRPVSHYGTGPMLGLSLPGSPRAFPPREGMGPVP